jgi:hypothetical protein
LADATSLEKRFIPLIGAAIALSIGTNIALFSQIKDPNRRPIIASHASLVAMDATVEKVLNTCLYVNVNDTTLVPSSTDPAGFGLMIGSSPSLAVDTDEIDGLTSTCTEENTNKREYVIWPVNGLDVDSLRAQLLVFDPALDEHVSVNAEGTLYFRAFLKMADVVEVTTNKQVIYHFIILRYTSRGHLLTTGN